MTQMRPVGAIIPEVSKPVALPVHRLGRALRGLLDSVLPLSLAALAWEVFARSGIYKRVLTPTLEDIFAVTVKHLGSGVLLADIAFTLYRLLSGFLIGALAGIMLGALMARLRLVERFFQPLVSVLNPIPSLAWIPLFILWFGLGETATIVLVAFATVVPVTLNVWTGGRAVNEVWLRAAESMECRSSRLFFKVILPASVPFIVSGLRGGMGRGWRAVVAGEMIAATSHGLGWVIFNSIAFLNTDVMLSAILFIGLIGLVIENGVFAAIERATVMRWGMLRDAGS
jgi:NitT/TauT family transport system permease protein